MDITSLSAAATGLANTRTRAQGDTDPVAQAFQKADKRIQRQREAVSIQLSSFGKLQSSFSEIQVAARALSDAKQTATDADIAKAAGNFVKAFNNAAQTARSATAKHGTLAENSRARATERDLRQSVGNTALAASDLKTIGITQQKDGTLAIDTKKFDVALKSDPDALRTTLTRIGQQVDRTATHELARSGNIGGSVSSLDNRAKNLESQQTEQQAQAVAAQQVISAQSTRFSDSLNTGAAAYQRVFSL